MKITGKIGFLGGGRMAEALIKGITQAGLFAAGQIVAVDPAEDRRQLLAQQYKVNVAGDSAVLADCEIVVVAVKAQVLPGLLQSKRAYFNREQLVISIAAGVSLGVLESSLAGCNCRLVRVMPNTPALIMEGAAALCGGSLANDDDLKTATAIFDAVGKSVVLDEAAMDARSSATPSLSISVVPLPMLTFTVFTMWI